MNAPQALLLLVGPFSLGLLAGVAAHAPNVHAPAILTWLSSILVAVLAGAGREEDSQLLARIAEGDKAALRALYAAVAPRAMAIALRLLKDRSEAEDVVQETFVEVWKRARQYEVSRGGSAAWVVAIARNRALDRLRAQGSGARTLQGAAAEPLPPMEPAPLELAERRRERERVHLALSSLPVEQRQVIELAYFDGLTQSEIALHTQEPLGTIKTRIRLAMAKLADVLGAEREGAA